MSTKAPLPWPRYPVVHPLTTLPCGCSTTMWMSVDGKLRVVDGLGREIPEVVDFDVVTGVATSRTMGDDGKQVVLRRDAYGSATSLAYDTTHGARLFCAHGEVRAVEQP